MVRSRYARGTVEVRLWCGRGTLVVRSRYARGAVERSRYVRGTVLVLSRYARGAFPVRCVSLTFQRAIRIYYECTIFMSHNLVATGSFSTWPYLNNLHPSEGLFIFRLSSRVHVLSCYVEVRE